MIKRISKRVVPLVAIVALMLNLVVAPQRARAVAVTAAVAASAAAILTACGVSYWAATQTDAVDYITGKLQDYLNSIEVEETPADWLEISAESQPFTVITGGVMRFTSGVANKLLDFCRWFVTEDGIVSGGEAVGNASLITLQSEIYSPYNSSYSGSANIEAISANQIKININGIKTETTTDICVQAYVPCIAGLQTRLSINSGNYSQSLSYKGTIRALYQFDSNMNAGAASMTVTSSSILIEPTRDTFLLRYVFPRSVATTPLDGYAIIDLSTSELGEESTAMVTPSDFVNIPASVEDGAYFALTPSVDLASGDSVDTATQAILDGITSEDGLSSETVDTPNTAWGWLYTLLENIASTIGAGVSDIKDKLDGVKGSADDAASAAQGAATASQGAAVAAQDAATAAQGVETAVEGLQSTAEGIEDNTATIARNLAPATYGDVADYQLDLTSLFPFCIPRDIYTAISLFASEPEAPSIDWDMPLPNGSTYHIHYDLAQWDNIASLLRHLELLLYGVGLMMATKSIIKW